MGARSQGESVGVGDLGDTVAFFALACAISWALDARLAFAWATHAEPPGYALPLVGLGAFGPVLAASVIAARRGRLRELFGRWRTRPLWIAVALAMPFVVHLAATLAEVALGGHPAHWLYPPNRPEYVAALVCFSIGEEPGWRGFAYPRLEARFGPVAGALVVGAVWGLWHLGMMFTPEHGAPSIEAVVSFIAELAAWSVVVAWVFERGDRSLLVAFAAHAGGHLDNPTHGPETELRLRVLRFVATVIAAALAARALRRRPASTQLRPGTKWRTGRIS
jgi:membrane protease YdiL (CAAX protease family)